MLGVVRRNVSYAWACNLLDGMGDMNNRNASSNTVESKIRMRRLSLALFFVFGGGLRIA